MAYLPITDENRRAMLARIGVGSIEELLSVIPPDLRLARPLDIEPLSEIELVREMESLAGDNKSLQACFAGGGVYDHFVPAAVQTILSRPEFVTAYTPYQPEVSQGTLQVIYEFQTHICRLTGMDVANASLYDGATAAAEALLLAVRAKKRDKVIVSESVSPLVREVLATYLPGRAIELVTVAMTNGFTDPTALAGVIDDNTAGVLIGQPNFFGLLEEVDQIEKVVHSSGALLIMSIDPIAQALLKTPGEIGADIVIGEGQPLGLAMNLGGPLLGFMATSQQLVRSLPGRLAGRTKDIEGRPGFVLTLQTREQHIRRNKATSNICTNQALCATTATVYMSLMGKTGLRRVALLSAERAQETARKVFELDGFEPYFGDQPYVREFAVKTPIPARELVLSLVEKDILPGVDAGRWYRNHDDCLIVATTEKRTAPEISDLVKALDRQVKSHAMSEVSK